MVSDDSDLRDIIAFVTRHLACGACQSPYRPADVKSVMHNDIRWILVATCPNCLSERPVTAYEQPPYIQVRREEPIVTGEVTCDVVDEWRAFLTRFDGDMYDLFDNPET